MAKPAQGPSVMAVTDLANTEIALLQCLASRCHGNAATRGLNKVRQR